jgi:hypothetical protein
MLNAFSQKYQWHSIMDTIFNEFTITIGVPVVTFATLVISNIWRYMPMTLLVWLMYLTFFFGMYYYLTHQMSYFQSFVIATLSIFAISEIWEIPIKLNNLLTLQSGQVNILIMTAFKMSSIPMLLYFSRKWKWKLSSQAKEFFLVLVLIATAIILQGFSDTSVIYGIFLRIVVGSTVSLSVLGYSRNALGK